MKATQLQHSFTFFRLFRPPHRAVQLSSLCTQTSKLKVGLFLNLCIPQAALPPHASGYVRTQCALRLHTHGDNHRSWRETVIPSRLRFSYEIGCWWAQMQITIRGGSSDSFTCFSTAESSFISTWTWVWRPPWKSGMWWGSWYVNKLTTQEPAGGRDNRGMQVLLDADTRRHAFFFVFLTHMHNM